MTAGLSLVFTGQQFTDLMSHLFPGDGKEVATILLCADAGTTRQKLLVRHLFNVPYEECKVRNSDYLTWPGQRLSSALDIAEKETLSLVLVHSHPSGQAFFSSTDDESDIKVIGSIFNGWSGTQPKFGHGSAIVTSDGRVRARMYDKQLKQTAVGAVWIIGNDLIKQTDSWVPQPTLSFSSDMTDALSQLHVCIIGASGTGSIVTEQIARLGVGKVTLIDFDRIEHRNLNRILNSTLVDAERRELKVDVLARATAKFRNDIEFIAVAESIMSRRAILAAAEADIIFSCVDSAEGRQIADFISQAFLIPLIDVGVSIPTRRLADGSVRIADVLGRIDYIQPGKSSLADRQVFSPESLRAEYLTRVAPDALVRERQEGYIKGVVDEAPSVISLNMRAASAAVIEFIARLFPYRFKSNKEYARTLFSLADNYEDIYSEDTFVKSESTMLATGMQEPLLGIPALGKSNAIP